MDERDLQVRNETYRRFVDLGRAPAPAEVAAAVGAPVAEVEAAWRRLHDAHALVLDDDGSLRMANPFSAVPTPYRVEAAGRSWYANCAWDAFGICAALHVDGRIDTTCQDCGEPISVAVAGGRPDDGRPDDGRPDDGSLVFHCLVPAAHWWDDIVHT